MKNMCGIFGYLGDKEAAPILLGGLRQLEYRGYDSAGVALLYTSGEVEVTRTTNRLGDLENKLGRLNGHALAPRAGIGHTRWATHGRPSEVNAHPHTSLDGKIAVVHNGIFENFMSIRTELQQNGDLARSETDTECFPMLLSHIMAEGRDYGESFGEAVRRMRGKYALACVHADHPEKILLARSGPPLVVGIGQGEYFVASDVAPLLAHTRDVVYLEDGDVGELATDGLRVFDRNGNAVEREVHRVEWDRGVSDLGGYRHFMHKEIFEQPVAISRTIEAHLDGESVALGLPFSDEFWKNIDGISILACGTSWHAGLVAKFLIEQIARIPVDVDYASEFRYRDPLVLKNALAIAITQSGETADTIAALKEAQVRGARTLAICNSVGSQITRLAESVLFTHAGLEMGVASTKSFSTQLAVLTLLAIHLGRVRGTISADESAALIAGLRSLPGQIEHVHTLERELEALALEWHATPTALYLGRGLLYPVALEGALKLKEISYIHAQGFPAGEMKHGPIALIDANMPVIGLLPDNVNRDRMLSNLQEAAARGAPIIAFVSEGEHALDSLARTVIRLPAVHPSLAPILYTVPLQLFAYHVAVLRGCDVDRPRNLAKSVTVE
jgi:glucosamine--fructose-6-phosphate aminotransferase (isomerizing)